MDKMLSSVSSYLSEFVETDEDRAYADRIIFSMTQIDRKFFAPFDPYRDDALPIGYGQTISQPSTVARMLFLSDLKPGQRVLEIGSGSGWNAALISSLIYPGSVLSLEVVPELVFLSQNNLDKLKHKMSGEARLYVHNIEFRCQNVIKELDNWHEQYDRVLITAGVVGDDPDLVQQLGQKLLKEGGRMICPRELGPLYIVYKVDGKIEISKSREQYGFVPLIT